LIFEGRNYLSIINGQELVLAVIAHHSSVSRMTKIAAAVDLMKWQVAKTNKKRLLVIFPLCDGEKGG
jgi:hypothetical protein